MAMAQPSSSRSATSTTELKDFWLNVAQEIKDLKHVKKNDFRVRDVPLTRIRKIMKQDENVKQINGEVLVLFAKAIEIFIHELTQRAWTETEAKKRKLLRRDDIVKAWRECDTFDFLIDILRWVEVEMTEETKPTNSLGAEQVLQQPTVYPAMQQATLLAGQQFQSAVQQQEGLKLMKQICGPNGESQYVPIPLTPYELKMLLNRMEFQGACVQGNEQGPIVTQEPPPFCQEGQ